MNNFFRSIKLENAMVKKQSFIISLRLQNNNPPVLSNNSTINATVPTSITTITFINNSNPKKDTKQKKSYRNTFLSVNTNHLSELYLCGKRKHDRAPAGRERGRTVEDTDDIVEDDCNEEDDDDEDDATIDVETQNRHEMEVEDTDDIVEDDCNEEDDDDENELL